MISKNFKLVLLAVLFPVMMNVNAASEETKSELVWESIGPGAGGAFFALAIHPKNPDIIFTGTDMGCLFRSENGGKSWSMLGGSEHPGYRGSWNVVFDNANPDIVWAAGNHGIYKSLDTGKTWKRVTSSIADQPLAFFGIAIDPSDSNIVYICQGSSPRSLVPWSHGRVWKTLDGGNSWKELARPLGPLGKNKDKQSATYSFLVIDPKSEFVKGKGHKRVFIGGPYGFFVSEDAGNSWVSLSDKIGYSDIDSFMITEKDGKSILFAAVHPVLINKETGKYRGGIFRSDDSGKTWKGLAVNEEKFMETMAKLNGSDGRTYALFIAGSPQKPSRIYLGSGIGVYRSDDLGEKWAVTTKAGHEWYNFTDKDGRLGYYSLKRHGGNFENSYKGGIDCFNNMTVCQSNSDIVAFADNVTMTLSKDGGKTWKDLTFEYAEAFAENKFGDRPPMQYTHKMRNIGIQDINPNKIAVDPFDENTIFMTYADLGLRISRDGGKTWEYSIDGIVSNRNRTQANSITFDPDVKGRAYLDTATHGAVYLTEDGGRNWQDISIKQLVSRAEKQSKDKHFQGGTVVDGNSPPDKRILYNATDFGVYKSSDGGKTWDDSSFGLEDAGSIKVLAINPADSKILFAGSCPFNAKNSSNPSAGLYISKDAGRNWLRVEDKKIGAVYSMAICRKKPDTIYVLAADPEKAGYWSVAKLWKSEDGGKTWNTVFAKENMRVRVCAVNPENPDIVYIANTARDLNSEKVSILRSKDGGKTWSDITGNIPISHPRNFYVYEKDPSQIYYGDHFSAFKAIDPVAKMKQ